MEDMKDRARLLLNDFKADRYQYGMGVFDQLGTEVAKIGKRVSIVMNNQQGEKSEILLQNTKTNLERAGLIIAGDCISGARPNAPSEDVYAIMHKLKEQQPDVVVSIGGGSTTDAVKAAIALLSLEDKYPDLDAYFGTGEVSKMLFFENKRLLPQVAVMTAASSAAHLTKYANVTNMQTGQKLLIVDEAVTPCRAVFDYSFTVSQFSSLTMDGALDGISHCLEVLMGIPEALLPMVLPVSLTGIELIVNNLRKVVVEPSDIQAREAIALGTDLGGYAIMLGGTNGAHLNSFSLTDILSHGRACALMNPYYVVFFSPRISNRLRMVGEIFQKAGYIKDNLVSLDGVSLGLAVAKGMIRLSEEIGFPTKLKDVPGYSEAHKIKCLEAAKNPQLKSKLRNMPVPMSVTEVDVYMRSVLEAAEWGCLETIKTM